MTLIYNYSNITGEYLSSEDASYSPIEEGVILLPAFATIEAPPVVLKGSVAVFSGGSWSIQEDHRGTVYWLPDFSQNVQIDLGPFPEGSSLTAPEDHVGIIYWLPDGSQHIMATKGPLPIGASTIAPAPTKDQIIQSFNSEVQVNLDNIAKSWGYDSLLSAVSYATSSNPQYKADADSLIAWRDSIWAEAYTIEQGTLPDTAEAFVAMLPAAPTKPTV